MQWLHKNVTQLGSNHLATKNSPYLQTEDRSSITPRCRHLMRLVAADFSLVAPNQRRTETGIGTQCPPRTDCPGPTREGFEFPRLGWSVPLSLSQNREGLPSPPLERSVAVIYTRVGGPRALNCMSDHHRQWRFKRFDAPRSGPQTLELAEALPNRWPRPIQPNKLAYFKRDDMRTFIVIRLLRARRRLGRITNPTMGIAQRVSQVVNERHRCIIRFFRGTSD